MQRISEACNDSDVVGKGLCLLFYFSTTRDGLASLFSLGDKNKNVEKLYSILIIFSLTFRSVYYFFLSEITSISKKKTVKNFFYLKVFNRL